MSDQSNENAAQAPATNPNLALVAVPWGADSTRGNIAIGELRDNLLKALTNERGVHTETLMVFIGAFHGFATAAAAHAKVARGQATLMEIGLPDGGRAYMGDALNAHIVPEDDRIIALWSLIAAAAIESGATLESLPVIQPMFSHNAATMGSADYGQIRVEGQAQPLMGVRDTLFLWPMALQLFRRVAPPTESGKPLAVEYWPFVAATVATIYIGMTKDALDPRTAFTLVMQASIAASKLDPNPVQP